MNKLVCFCLLLFSFRPCASAQACGSRQLDPGIARFLDLVGYRDQSLEELRRLPIEVVKYPDIPLRPYPQEDVRTIRITEDSIRVLVFNPHHRTGLPIIINYHGGGFIAPLVAGLEHDLWQEAKALGAIVFAVDYRVAPEHPFPAALDDSYGAFKWIAEHGRELGGDTGRLVLLGNSAGANLVAVIAQRARKDGLANRIRLQVLNGLPADLRPEHMETSPSYRENAAGYFHTKAASYFALENYAPGQAGNPEVSPLLAADLQGLPPALVITAEFDPLRDDGRLYAEALRKAGVKVREKCFAGQIHCLIGTQPGSPAANEYEALVRETMQESFRNQ